MREDSTEVRPPQPKVPPEAADVAAEEQTPRPRVPAEILTLALAARRVTVLTGAGMSAESGVPTFRDALTGLWEHYDPAVLTSIGAWRQDPHLVWAWHLWLAGLMHAAEPNAGHLALTRWASHPGAPAPLRVVTQNIDDLHARAGSAVHSYLHGSITAFRCSVCAVPYRRPVLVPDRSVGRATPPSCGVCGGAVRPGVVWFGEVLPSRAVENAAEAMTDADLVLVVGTSGIVQPAASLPFLAGDAGVPVIEINPAPTRLSASVDHVWRTTAAVPLPALVDAVCPVA